MYLEIKVKVSKMKLIVIFHLLFMSIHGEKGKNDSDLYYSCMVKDISQYSRIIIGTLFSFGGPIFSRKQNNKNSRLFLCLNVFQYRKVMSTLFIEKKYKNIQALVFAIFLIVLNKWL